MNKFVLFAAATAMLVGGCASYPPGARYDNVDVQKVASIDRVSRTLGVDVHWINYPQRKGIVTDPAAPTGT